MDLYEKFYFKASFKIGARDINGFYPVRVDSLSKKVGGTGNEYVD